MPGLGRSPLVYSAQLKIRLMSAKAKGWSFFCALAGLGMLMRAAGLSVSFSSSTASWNIVRRWPILILSVLGAWRLLLREVAAELDDVAALDAGRDRGVVEPTDVLNGHINAFAG